MGLLLRWSQRNARMNRARETGGPQMSAKISTLLLAVLLAAPWAIGQSTFGGIVGVVKDPSQEAVGNAHVTLTSLNDRTQRAANTDANGEFEEVLRFVSLTNQRRDET
jgi:hypothetical protein